MKATASFRGVLATLVGAAAMAGCSTPTPTPTPVPDPIIARASAGGIPSCTGSSASTIPGVTGQWTCLGGGQVEPARTGGKPLLLVFYAQWCAPCRQEMPHVATVLPSLDGVEVYLVNSGETNQELAVDLLVETGVRGVRVLSDPDWHLMSAMGAPHSLPRSLWVTPSGQILRHEGPWTDAAMLRTWIEQNRQRR